MFQRFETAWPLAGRRLGVEMLTFDHHPGGQKAVDHCEHSLAGHCCEFATAHPIARDAVCQKTIDVCVTDPVYFLRREGVRLPILGARRTRVFVANKHPKSQLHLCGIYPDRESTGQCVRHH